MIQHAAAPDRIQIPAVAPRGGDGRQRHVLAILDLAPEEVRYLSRRAVCIKDAAADPQTLRGRTVGVYFRKTSTRPRAGFMVGAGKLGATTVYFRPDPAWRTRFAPFRVSRALMDRVSGPGTVFVHDLPAVRNEDVDDEVLDGPRSLAWVRAQHKMFSARAVMEWCAVGIVDDEL